MSRPLDELLAEISRQHFPYPPATPEWISEFESRVGWRLEPDMRAFYLHCDGAELFKRLPNAPYQLLPLAEIRRARIALRGEDDDHWGPASLYTLCDVQDGDYVLLDTAPAGGPYPILDGYREPWPDPDYRQRIADSFTEFLDKALRSQGQLFYLQSATG